MDNDYFLFFRKRLHYLFIFAIWILTIIRNNGGSVYYSIIFALLLYIPFTVTDISIAQHVTLFSSLIMLFSSITLTNFDISYQIFIVFLNFNTIEQMKNSSLYGILNIILFGVSIIQTTCSNLQYIILVLCLNFISCYVISIFTDYQFFPKTFTFTSSCLTSFLQCSAFQPFNSIIFIFSLFLSLPHFPLPVSPQRISYKNFKVIIYIILTVICNIISIEYGLIFNALSLVSDAMMSMCNCITMIGEIIADIASFLPPTKKFPYGFKRGTIICDFAVTILLIYVTFDLISTAITEIISNDFYLASTESTNSSSSLLLSTSPSLVSSVFSLFSMKNKFVNQSFFVLQFNNTSNITNTENINLNNDSESPMSLLYIALLGMLNNLFGVFFLGTIQIKTCTIADDGNSMSVLSDFISSFSVVLCSIFSVFFNINYLDPFVSILISLMILILSINRMIKLLMILLQKIPTNFNKKDFLVVFDDNPENLPQFNAWSLNEIVNVVSLKIINKKPDDAKVFRGIINNIAQNDENLILTYEI